MVAALVAILAPATAAAAAPTPEQIDKQIAAQEDKLEAVVEAYNKVNIELAGSQSQAQQANDQLTVLVGRLADARTRTDQIAVLAYEGGPLVETTALLSSGDPQILMGRLTSVAQITAAQQDELTTAARSKADHDTQSRIKAIVADQTGKQQASRTRRSDHRGHRPAQALRTKYAGPRRRSPRPARRRTWRPGGLVVNYAYPAGQPYQWAAAGRARSTAPASPWPPVTTGVDLPHNAAMRWNAMPPVAVGLQPGDLVFYRSLNQYYLRGQRTEPSMPLVRRPRRWPASTDDPYGYGRPR
jgi:hypothetical protein